MSHEEETRSLGDLVALCESVLEAASPRAKLAFGAAMWQLVRGADGETIPKAAADIEKSAFKAGGPAETLLRALVHCGGVIEFTDERGNGVWSLATPSLMREWPRLREFIRANSALLKTRDRISERARTWMTGGGRSQDLIPPGPDLDACRGLMDLMIDRLLQPEIVFIEASLAEEDRELSKLWTHRLKKRLVPVWKFIRTHPVGCLFCVCLLVVWQFWNVLPFKAILAGLSRLQQDFAAPGRGGPDPTLADFVAAAKRKPSKPKLPSKPNKPSMPDKGTKAKAEAGGEKGGAGGGGDAESEEGTSDPGEESESSGGTSTTTKPGALQRRLSAEELARGALKRIEAARRAGIDPGPAARRELWQSLSMGMDQGPVCTGTASVQCAIFHPIDGSILTADGDGWLRAWSRAADGRAVQLRQMDTGLRDIRVLRVAADGSVAAVAQTGAYRLFDARGQPRGAAAKPPKAAASVACAAVSRDAAWLAVAADGQTIRVSRTDAAGETFEFTAGIQSVVSLALTTDGAHVACGGDEGEVEIWDVREKMRQSLLQVGSRVLALTFHQNRLTAVGADGSMASWNHQSPTRDPMRVQGQSAIFWASFDGPPGTLHEIGIDGLRVVDLQGVLKQPAVPLPEPPAQPMALSPDGRWLVTAAPGSGPRLVAVGGPAVPAPELEAEPSVRGVAFNTAGDRLVTARENRELQVWDLTGCRVGEPLRGLETAADRVAFTTRGANVLAIAEREMKLYSWRLASANLVTLAAGLEATTTRAAPAGGKLRLARGGRYRATVIPPAGPRVYETRGGLVCALALDPKAAIVDLDFDGAAGRLATVDATGSAKVWALTGKKLLDCPKALVAPAALAWDVAGRNLAFVGARGGLVWNLGENRVTAHWKSRAGPLHSVAFHPAEPLVATRAKTGETLLRTLDGVLAAPPLESGPSGAATTDVLPGALAFSPDGRLIALVSASRRVRLRRCGLEDAIRAATSRLKRLDSAAVQPISTGAAQPSPVTTPAGLGSDW